MSSLTHDFCSSAGKLCLRRAHWPFLTGRASFGLPPGWVSVFLPSGRRLPQKGDGAWLLPLYLWVPEDFLWQGQAWQVTTGWTLSTLFLEGICPVFWLITPSPFWTVRWRYKKQFWCHHLADPSNCSSEVEQEDGSRPFWGSRKPSLASRSAFLPCEPPAKISRLAGDRDPFFVFCFLLF